jgi:hydrogenase expression/formation protein HypD
VRYRVPIVVTGFEPIDILQGVHACIVQLEQGRAEVENRYARSVRDDGNEPARRAIEDVFEVAPRRWRGLGEMAGSGLALRSAYARFDAERRFPLALPEPAAEGECRSGAVLRGTLRPFECPAFGARCTPESPLGAPMVSTEGACAAYYRYRPPAGSTP